MAQTQGISIKPVSDQEQNLNNEAIAEELAYMLAPPILNWPYNEPTE